MEGLNTDENKKKKGNGKLRNASRVLACSKRSNCGELRRELKCVGTKDISSGKEGIGGFDSNMFEVKKTMLGTLLLITTVN